MVADAHSFDPFLLFSSFFFPRARDCCQELHLDQRELLWHSLIVTWDRMRELAGKLSEARNRVEALDETKPPPKPAWAPQRGPQIRENDTPGASGPAFTGADPEFRAYLQIRYGTGEHALQQQRAFLPELPPEQAELMRDSSGAGGYSPYPDG